MAYGVAVENAEKIKQVYDSLDETRLSDTAKKIYSQALSTTADLDAREQKIIEEVEEEEEDIPSPPPTLEEQEETEDKSNLYRDNTKNLNLQIDKLQEITKRLKGMTNQLRRMKNEYNK